MKGEIFMKTIKNVLSMVFATAISTLTMCKVVDLYNKYAHDDVARADLKRKIKKLFPFNKNRLK